MAILEMPSINHTWASYNDLALQKLDPHMNDIKLRHFLRKHIASICESFIGLPDNYQSLQKLGVLIEQFMQKMQQFGAIDKWQFSYENPSDTKHIIIDYHRPLTVNFIRLTISLDPYDLTGYTVEYAEDDQLEMFPEAKPWEK